MPTKPEPVRLSDGEWKVMEIVWSAGSANARDVTDALAADTGWAYTTVKTLMTRLVAKGALTESMEGNAAVYVPAVARDAARRTAVRGLLDRAFGGDLVPMVRFLLDDASVSTAERKRLRALLDERKKARRP